MKPLALLWGAAALVLGSCTFQSVPAHGGKVIISAGAARAEKPRSFDQARALVPHRAHPTPVALLPRSAPRALPYSNIVAITYTVSDLNTGSVVESGDVDLSYLSIELYLNPGGHYRIVVDVEVDSGAPGADVGVKRYGDQADFWVDDYYDTYVDLIVHPTETLVFDAASAQTGNPSTISVFDPSDGSRSTVDFFNAPIQVSPADKLFFGPDASLYYFNQDANAVYVWRDIGTPIDPSGDKVVDGTSQSIQIYAACADQNYDGWLYLVGQSTSDSGWKYWNLEAGLANSIYSTVDITYFLDYGFTGSPTVVPTGIANDTTWYQDVYVTYYAHDNTEGIQSGTLAFYAGDFYSQLPWDDILDGSDDDPTDGTLFDGSTDGIYTDAFWASGKLWVTTAPNRALSTALTNNMGKANVRVVDDYLNPASDVTLTAGQNYAGPGALPALSSSTGVLVLPNRMLSVQGPSVYLGQTDYTAAADDQLGANIISSLDIDSSDVTSY